MPSEESKKLEEISYDEIYADKPFSRAFQKKKDGWYGHINVSIKQLDVIIGIGIAALAVVAVLIVLEAAGIYKIG